MTYGLRPTEEQKKIMVKHGYDPSVWNVWKDESKVLLIINKTSGNRQTILKEVK